MEEKDRILIVGGNGTIGRCVSERFLPKFQVITAGRSSGDVRVDIADTETIGKMFDEVGNVDAIVCAAGDAKWAPFSQLTEEDYFIGLRSKLMGQVNLVRLGLPFLNPNGSITLTTGILADYPVVLTSSAAMVNGGIHSFVKAVSLELDDGKRINAVSSGLVEDAVQKYEAFFPGHNPVPMSKVSNAYVRSVEGKDTGQIFKVYEMA